MGSFLFQLTGISGPLRALKIKSGCLFRSCLWFMCFLIEESCEALHSAALSASFRSDHTTVQQEQQTQQTFPFTRR